jgi:hypothetical protein
MDEHSQHCARFPIYSTGQGSGNSPMVWLVISSILFDCCEDKAHSSTFESPDGTRTNASVSFWICGQHSQFCEPVLREHPPNTQGTHLHAYPQFPSMVQSPVEVWQSFGTPKMQVSFLVFSVHQCRLPISPRIPSRS